MVAQGRRWVYFFVAWAFLISLLIQVFLAGLVIFEGGIWETHRDFGYGGVHIIGLVLIVFAAISKLPRRDLVVAIVAPVFSFIMPVFATLGRQGFPFVGALHPLSAVILFGLAILLVVWARDLVPPPWGRAKTAGPAQGGD